MYNLNVAYGTYPFAHSQFTCTTIATKCLLVVRNILHTSELQVRHKNSNQSMLSCGIILHAYVSNSSTT